MFMLFGFVMIVFVPGLVKKKELELEETDESGLLED